MIALCFVLLLQDDFAAAFNQGLTYSKLREWDKAVPRLTAAARLQPGDFNSHYLLGAAQAQLGHNLEALTAWRAALRLRPGHVGLLQLMVVEYGKGNYFGEALTVARQAYALKPDDVNVALMMLKACSDAGAPSLAKDVAAKFPGHPRTNFEYAYQLQRAGQFAESMPYLKKAMELAPEYEEPFYLFGEYLIKSGAADAAVEAYRRALVIRSDYLLARMALARALMQLSKLDEAAEVLKGAEGSQPHLLLSQIYFRLGDEGRARKEKLLSLKLRRENPGLFESPQGRTFP